MHRNANPNNFQFVSAYIASFYIYRFYMRDYYDLKDLRVYPLLDVAKTTGDDVLDASRIYFAQDNELDHARSWHFKHRETYCVAPIVKKRAANGR